MVDALHEAHRSLRSGGTLIDLRPDSSHPPRVRHGRTELGGLYERRTAIVDNRWSDRAVTTLVRDGRLRPIRAGHFWYELRFGGLAELDGWLETSRRIGGYTRGTRAALARQPGRPIVIRRALAYGIYERR